VFSRLRGRRPSPALVVATLALFVALGGTVWAASRIDGRRIAPKSLPGNRLIVGSVSGNRLRPGSIGGNRIKSSSLGRVPSAAHAEAADAAKTADTAIHAQAASDSTTVNGYGAGCATGMRLFAGACWELRTQAAALNANEAAAFCAREGGELPRVLSLKAFGEQSGIGLDSEGEWSGDVTSPSSPNIYAVLTVSSSGVVDFIDARQLRHFRCVIPLVH
jgi:hypothetical protein